MLLRRLYYYRLYNCHTARLIYKVILKRKRLQKQSCDILPAT